MTDPEVVQDDTDIDSPDKEDERKRRWWVVLAAIALLLLLLFCCVAASEVWYLGGKEQARFVARNLQCLQCHVELIPDFSKQAVHDPFAKKECTTCHTPHGKKVAVVVSKGPSEYLTRLKTVIQWLPLRWWLTVSESISGTRKVAGSTSVEGTAEVKDGTSKLVVPETELCWTCHGSMGAKLRETFQHMPFATGQCTGCHDPHASDHRALLTQAANKICFTCHPIGTEINRKQAHRPAADGWCIDCHDPHASNFAGILVAGQRDLCFGCHPSVATLSGMAVQHAPFLNDDCTGCHQPHGSEYPPLLNAVQPDLCYECHPGIENQFSRPSHHPVGVKLECGSCHDPHAAQYAALINAQDNEFCYQCHGRIEAGFSASQHQERLCVDCHTPHGSAYKPVLIDRNPDLCLDCHAKSNFDEASEDGVFVSHPVQPNRYDVNAESPLTCTSSCHNPHGTDKNHMLRYFSSPYDGGCLMCHATTRGSRVGIDY